MESIVSSPGKFETRNKLHNMFKFGEAQAILERVKGMSEQIAQRVYPDARYPNNCLLFSLGYSAFTLSSVQRTPNVPFSAHSQCQNANYNQRLHQTHINQPTLTYAFISLFSFSNQQEGKVMYNVAKYALRLLLLHYFSLFTLLFPNILTYVTISLPFQVILYLHQLLTISVHTFIPTLCVDSSGW